jgi:acetyl-CoA carboxylase carboxyl transferase subunit alpha
VARFDQGPGSRHQYEDHGPDLIKFGVIDEIVPEPVGGAHRDPAAAIKATGQAIAGAFAGLKDLDGKEIRRQRREKFLAIGRTSP